MEQLGSYRLRKRLAVGGMGEVYLGEKVGPEGFVKPVVLKCVLPQLAKDRAFVQLFLDEARLAALLNHPNIAQVYDFGLVDGIYYIAMEYVAGYTVDDIRRKLRSIRQFMPLQHVANIASQACQGLHYAHGLTDARGEGLGLVHRDISPHNLIVSIDGSVKIVDFGIAKARAGLTRVQAKGAVGKFGYMSPEQSRGEAVDGRSDLFSLGVCLWELTSNERLHDPNLERAPDYSPARPVRSVEPLRPEIPRQFTQILETALAIEADDRYPSAQAMHLALERFQAAMTHYAGQSALAGFIKDLVEGRVEEPERERGGGVVQPAESSAARTGPGARSSRPQVNMDAAQKYEEVFGVTFESKRGRPQLRHVPKSWEAHRHAPVPPEPEPEPDPAGGSRELELDSTGHRVPELDLYASPPGRPHPSRPPLSKPPNPARSASRSFPWVWLSVLALLGALGAAGWLNRHRLPELWAQIQTSLSDFEEDQVPKSGLTNRYRVESAPPGRLWLDGQLLGETPIDTELIPGVEHELEVRKPGYAPAYRRVTGAVAEAVQTIEIPLEKAATIRVSTRPPGALVSVDGRVLKDRRTPTSVDVPAGRPVRVQVELEGRSPAVRTVQAGPGEKRTLRFVLEASTQ